MASEYIAGQTNIGEAEVSHRKTTYGWGGLTLAVALFIIIWFLDLSFFGYLILFFPIYASVSGFYQSKEKFCVSYGKSGICNIAGDIGETREVIGSSNRHKDLLKASRMTKVTLAIAAALTILIAAVFAIVD